MTPGSIVQLRSGGPNMTVQYFNNTNKVAICIYHNAVTGQIEKDVELHQSVLKVVYAPPETPYGANELRQTSVLDRAKL